MTTTRIYKSSDTSAPVLVGGVSSLINLLDKCLVTGYGSQTAAGWTKPFTGTDKAAFRNSVADGGTGMYLRVDDSGGGTGGAREALCRAYLTMSDVDTGTIETPTAAQVAASIVWRKSDTVDATARSWILIADELTFYLYIDSGTNGAGWGTFGSGDFDSHVPGDAYRFWIVGRETQQAANLNGTHAGFCLTSGSLAAPSQAMWLARGYAGSGSPIQAGFLAPLGAVRIGSSANTVANPAPGSGLLHWIPAIIAGESVPRGRMRGLYLPLNNWTGVAAGNETVNPPGLTGTLVSLRHFGNTNGTSSVYDCHVHVDKTGPWS